MIQFDETTDLLRVLCVLNEVYEKQMDPELLMWLDRCTTGANRWFLATDRGRDVAVYGLLPRYAVVNGIVVRAHLANNAGVVKTHRDKGLFREIGRYVTERSGVESDLFIGCSNSAAMKGHLAAGWTHIADLDLMNGYATTSDVGLNQLPKLYHDQPITGHCFDEHVLFMKRDAAFREWRYSRAGIEYMSMLICDRWVIWKKYDGRRQIMEINGWPMLDYLDGEIDIWAVCGSDLHAHLAGREFEIVYTRHLVIKPNGSCAMDPNAIRFELADNDVY